MDKYWDRITAIYNHQREKGLKKYGLPLEDNPASIDTRIRYIEEELVDALMYCEWVRDELRNKGGQIKEEEKTVSVTRKQAATWFETMHPPGPAARKMYRMAAKALRPVSWEQVEKVWRGCNNCRTCDSCAYRYIKAEEEPCWSCNTNIYSNYKPEPNRKFCPACGAPMTDEAVEIMLKRMEALLND